MFLPNLKGSYMEPMTINALQVPKKDMLCKERDATSSVVFSDFIDNETVEYKIEVTDASSEQCRQSVEASDNTGRFETSVTSIGVPRESSVQHSEILQSKPCLSRRVTGANRVVPFITSLWQKGELKAFEPTVYSAYMAILNNPENSEERLCEICHNEFLSSTEVEAHVREIHRKEYIMPQQCFVCTKMYVFEAQLERHLSISHGIQYPEMICKICFMEFNTAIEKKAHERKHDKIYSCHFCSSKFASEYSWQKHYTEHLIAKKPYQCTKCGKRFCQRISLTLHKRRHGQCWCSLCHSFFKELQFLLHLEHHLPTIQRNFLNSIERMDQEESYLEEVMNTYFQIKISCHDSWKFKEVDQDVSGCVDSMISAVSNVLEVDFQPTELPQKDGLECKLCGLEMSSAIELLEHCRKSHRRSRTCPFCGKRSRSVSQTFRHMKTHVDKRKSNKGVTQSSKTNINGAESVLECQLCNRVYPNKGKLNYHLETVHKMNIVSRPYSCTICDRKFQYKAARDRHMLLHSKEKNACWKCAVCDQAFLRPKFLLKHVKEHKAENVCHVCNRIFSKQAKLALHLKSHNPFITRKRLNCSVCCVTCPSITTLREHIRTHTGERPYSCDQCELKFKRSQALKQHLIGIHNQPGSTSFACSLCGAAFKRRGNLMRHILSCHQGVRRFICGLCGRRYAQNQDLRRHLITKHQMQLTNIPLIEKKPIQVYVYPPLEELPASDAQYINIIIAEEGLKIQKLLALESNTNRSTDIEQTIPLKSTVQVLNVKPVSRQENLAIQSKEFSEYITNKDSVTFVQEHSYIPLLSFQICTQCNNVTIRKHQSIIDRQNNSSNCEQCCKVREELPDLKAEATVVKPGLVITEHRSVSLENISFSNSEGVINDKLINEVLTTEFEEYLYENVTSLMNPDVDGASNQISIQNVMLQSNSAMPSKFSNENLLMATSSPPPITVQPADNNSKLTNNSLSPVADLPLNNMRSLKVDKNLLHFTSSEISAESDNCKSDKSSEEEKNDNISMTANKEA